MERSQQKVREFHRAFNYPTSPAEPKLRDPELRASLIMEEAIETVIALVGAARAQTIVQHQLVTVLQAFTRAGKTKPDLVEAIDGLADLQYVIAGTFEDIGVDGEIFFDEVHRSNMMKVGGSIDENGKIQKPAGWTPPDIEGVLARMIAIDQ